MRLPFFVCARQSASLNLQLASARDTSPRVVGTRMLSFSRHLQRRARQWVDMLIDPKKNEKYIYPDAATRGKIRALIVIAALAICAAFFLFGRALQPAPPQAQQSMLPG